MHRRASAPVAVLVVMAGLAACERPPQPSDKTAPPEPQVEPQVAASALRAPLDRAAAVQATLDAGTAVHAAQAAAAGD